MTPQRKRGRPYVYSLAIVISEMLYCNIGFIRNSNNELHTFLIMGFQYNYKLVLACGLVTIPSSRRMFDSRLKTIYTTDVKERISTMGYLFAAEDMVDHTITATDSTFIKAKGPVWHKSSLKKGVVPPSGIDTDARWLGGGYSHT
jgi:hypothetical protein